MEWDWVAVQAIATFLGVLVATVGVFVSLLAAIASALVAFVAWRTSRSAASTAEAALNLEHAREERERAVLIRTSLLDAQGLTAEGYRHARKLLDAVSTGNHRRVRLVQQEHKADLTERVLSSLADARALMTDPVDIEISRHFTRFTIMTTAVPLEIAVAMLEQMSSWLSAWREDAIDRSEVLDWARGFPEANIMMDLPD